MVVAAAFGIVIGLTLGTVGGGGAVLAVPALVYAAGLDVHQATTASLAVVAAGAAVGAVAQTRRGHVCWRSAGWFAVAALGGSVIGTALNGAVADTALLLVFAAVMLLAARATWVRAGVATAAGAGCPNASPRILLPVGLGVGALTGLVGVGGGFVVVPVLAVGLSFGMREAMGTSMVVIAIVALGGLAAHLAAGNHLDVPVAAAMAAATVAGALAGSRLSDRVPVQALGRAFALIVTAVALGVATATAAGVAV
jgi:uncharacterized membrane protein YfcA